MAAGAHEQDAVLLRVVEPEADVGLATGVQLLEGIVDADHGLLHHPVERFELPLAHGEDQLVLVGEVKVDRRGGHAHRLGDAPDGHRLFAARLDQQALGGVEDLGVQQLAFAPTGAGATGGCG